ncbi:DNA-directed RNA polymerases I, II, and III subunit RPABC3 [Maudiozyma exigua]|uniref:DNA-directed RNA polymerases I, II, and III subunit RPABC3 n=1 Tax=Maudiozyma exigua TaxID=34358 RepID=A0A9P6W2N2_MAUEX|nr:DNA-directed RNA polymerases I, II, and III subunit RPABC3 [Kazachstania exigua]
MSNILFDDIFQIGEIDPGRYNRIGRIEATSTTQEQCKLTLDINTDLFPVTAQEYLTVTIASSLDVDGKSETESTTKSWRPQQPGERSLADDYEYVMHGTAYRFEEVSKDLIAVYYSFGGLLMRIEGNFRNLTNLKQENAYLLIRR